MIAIPTEGKLGLEEKVAEHFGRCKTYTLFDEKNGKIKVLDNKSEHKGGFGMPPEFIKNIGADILICRDIGPRAIALCKDLGIDVYVANSQTVKEAIEFWKNGKIKRADPKDSCKVHS
ncbi:MAG: NifB/NifX family molybdenum-iron cluster-binding protein [Candidatus Aenigmarchaeota archaeon]|nr:NifB/NifX family molybdenum-iron cluster-binding protein [Candidatus Aenigmarchaeota archaeon]